MASPLLDEKQLLHIPVSHMRRPSTEPYGIRASEARNANKLPPAKFGLSKTSESWLILGLGTWLFFFHT